VKITVNKIGFGFSLSLTAFFLWLLPSCQKEIQVVLPPATPKIVVEGKIEPGVPPYVILTHNMPYFGPTDINSIQNSFIHNAVVTVSDGTNTVILNEYCSQSLPDSLLPLVASFTGIDTFTLKSFNYCLYTSLNPSIFGQIGRTYSLKIDSDGKTVTASTPILQPIPLDTLWFRYEKLNSVGDSLGFIWAHLTEPGNEYNAYRWLAKRNTKDFSFIAPFNAATDDKFYNGQSFDFDYDRGVVQNSQAQDDNNEERGYFKAGDTVVVKFCTIDHAVYSFYRSLDIIENNNGNPFASPSSVESNVFPKEDALGIWCGYGVSTHTVVCK
jgi:hypothetical protein